MHSIVTARIGTALGLAVITLLLADVGVIRALGQSGPSAGDGEVPARIEAASHTFTPMLHPTSTSTTASTITTTTTQSEPSPPPTAGVPAPASASASRSAPASVSRSGAGAGTGDDKAYAMALLREVVPAIWLEAVMVRVEVIPGRTSWSYQGGLIEIGAWQLNSSERRARNTLAHEWGHQAAWKYGTDDYNGAPPAGFPYSGRKGEEMWSDSVGEVLTGVVNPTGGLPPCSTQAQSFTHEFLDAGPGG